MKLTNMETAQMRSQLTSQCFSSSGGGEVGPGRRLRLPLREAASDGSELHPAAHPHPALHLRGRRLEGLLLVHCARSWPSGGTTQNLPQDQA